MISPLFFLFPLPKPSPWSEPKREREVGEFIHRRTGCTISVYRNVSDKRGKTVDATRYISATHEFFLRLSSDFFFFLVIHLFFLAAFFHRCVCGRGYRGPPQSCCFFFFFF